MLTGNPQNVPAPPGINFSAPWTPTASIDQFVAARPTLAGAPPGLAAKTINAACSVGAR